jgi:Raf kinase inhibitor-like YbhB/YbcL family protein
MKLVSQSFRERARIPDEFVFRIPDGKGHFRLGQNLNPHLSWSDVPGEANSLVLTCHDPDLPTRMEDVNREGRCISASMPRTTFFHWLLLDIPTTTHEITVGSYSDGIVPGGKSGPELPGGMRHGLNDFTTFFANDPAMRGEYYGYDGPAPPWNDELVHRYVFTLYAINTRPLNLSGPLTGANIRRALAGHVLEEATLTGLYSLNVTDKSLRRS